MNIYITTFKIFFVFLLILILSYFFAVPLEYRSSLEERFSLEDAIGAISVLSFMLLILSYLLAFILIFVLRAISSMQSEQSDQESEESSGNYSFSLTETLILFAIVSVLVYLGVPSIWSLLTK